MPPIQPPPTHRHRARSTVLPGLAIVAALVGVLGCRSLAGASAEAPPAAASPAPHPTHERPRGDTRGVVGVADGRVPDDVTVFDDTYPAVSELDPKLLAAVRRAATDAADDRVTFYVNSGWRSPAYQDQLLREAVARYGSAAEAARWVATADTSPHVKGDAVDIAPSVAAAWLSEHGAEYGLCQIYANEPWHYELRPHAVARGCPARYADPTHDPRMTP